MTDMTPREIVSELDRFVIGQKDAKRAVAVALRNRWRRKQLDPAMQEEVYPKNILMIGPTGVGKTEISRRLAKLAHAPFLKVEATKFTEVGYVGRDVEQIIRDLVDNAIIQTRAHMREEVKARAEAAAEDRVIEAIAGSDAREQTREMFRKKLRDGLLDDHEIELDVADTSNPMSMFEIPGQPGQNMGMMNLGDVFGKAFGGRTTRRKMKVRDSYDVLIGEEADKLLDDETVTKAALEAVEQNGIVFLDEIDKVCARSDARGADAARPAAADRRHDRLDQARGGADRSYPFHRVGRVPHRQALGPVARIAGSPADPGRTARPDGRGFRAHPDRDRQRPDPAIHRLDGDGGGDGHLHRGRDQGPGGDRGAGQSER